MGAGSQLDPDQLALTFEDIEVAIGEAEEAREQSTNRSESPRREPKSNGASRSLPEDLPRVEKVIEPDSLTCPYGCGEMVRIGEDVSERLDIVPAQMRVLVTIRPKYASPKARTGVVQARAEPRLIQGGLPSEALIAHIMVAKYADHMPLYKQWQAFMRNGVTLDHSFLADWVGRASFHLTPIVTRLAELLKQSGKLFMDETTAPVLDPGRGRTKTGYLWALARDDQPWGGNDPPGVVFHYAPGRGGIRAETILDGFDGVLQVDGYAGYHRLARAERSGGDPLVLAHCWTLGPHEVIKATPKKGSAIADETRSTSTRLLPNARILRCGCACGASPA